MQSDTFRKKKLTVAPAGSFQSPAQTSDSFNPRPSMAFFIADVQASEEEVVTPIMRVSKLTVEDLSEKKPSRLLSTKTRDR